MTESHCAQSMVYRSEPSPGELQRVERHPFYAEGHDGWVEHQRDDPAYPCQPKTGGPDLPNVPGRAQLYQKIQQAGARGNLSSGFGARENHST